MANEPKTPTEAPRTWAEQLYVHPDSRPATPTEAPKTGAAKTWADLYAHPTSQPGSPPLEPTPGFAPPEPETKPATPAAEVGNEAPSSSGRFDTAGGFNLPESLVADEALLQDFRPLAKQIGRENAEKLLDLHGRVLEKQQEAQSAQTRTWTEQCERDSEIAGVRGDEFERNVGLAQGVLVKYGTLDLREALHTSGLGSHPGLVKLLVRVGRELDAARRT